MTYFVETASYAIVNVPAASIIFAVNGDFLRGPSGLTPIVNYRPTRQGDIHDMVGMVTGNGKFGCE